MSKVINSGVKLVLLGFLMVFVYLHDRLKIQFDYPFYPLFDNAWIRLAKGCLLVLVVYDLLRIYYYGIIKNPKAPKWLGNVSTLLVPVILLLVLLEITFMFIAQSHEGGMTLASKIWFERYWPPVNSFGYRDGEPTDTLRKKKVIVIGDSFSAGHGLKEVGERYSNVLAGKLGEKQYVVYNLGISGSDTKDEYQRFEKFGVRPDLLVLQYFPNDIEKAAARNGLVPNAFQPYSDVPGRLRLLFIHSYLLNYIYWQLPHGNFSPFDDYAKKAYSDPTILGEHLQDLGRFVDYSEKQKIRMIVVLFPFSHNLEKTKEYTRPVVGFFREHNIPVLDVGDLVKDMAPADRVVGRNDAHASAGVNRRVGESLYRLVMAGQ